MGVEQVLAVVGVVAYSSGAVWFFLHCVRPAFLWHRARWTSHLLFGGLSVVPAAVVVFASDSRPSLLAAGACLTALAGAFSFPRAAVRLSGGVGRQPRGIDIVAGWLSPAAERLDVGDIEGAQAQVDEARKYATPETLPYVDLWHALVQDEAGRRRGERISRVVRLDAIGREYRRLVLGDDGRRPLVEMALVVGVAVIVLGSLVAGG
jgi:hypothetical protein